MKRSSFVFLMVVLSISLQNNVISQETVKIKRITNPIDFDGIPNDTTWKTLDLFTMTMHKPNYGDRPSEKSEVRIGYDNEFLWIGASLYMEDASKIFAVTKKRDEMLFGYDAFGIMLDTYNDKENSLAFFTTPTGSRSDFAVFNDAAGGGPDPFAAMNTSWNTFWDVKITRDDKGWYVEMRIPFSSLKFKPENDKVFMGLIISRNISANNETDTYPAIDPKYGFLATYKPSLAQTIELEGTRPSRPVYISPYVIGSFSRDWSLNEEETGYVKEDNPQYNAGIW
jgi:hypothetical protein